MHKKKQLEYRNENREKLTKAQLNRYYSNHEESKSRSIDLRKKNREKYLAREKLWREKNCERVKPVRLLQRKNEYERMANVLSDRYIRMILNRNQTVYLKKEFLPKELIEVKRLEILLTSQMEANNDNAKQHN